jgi:hypothetical protein
MIEEQGKVYAVDVHELHNKACGGDPAVSPRLFSFEVDRKTGAMTTDALDAGDPEMQPIK